MPIDWNLRALMARKGFRNSAELNAGARGRLGSRATAYRLLRKGNTPFLVVLEVLCEILHCQPGDLLTYRGKDVAKPSGPAPPPPFFMLKTGRRKRTRARSKQ